MDQNGDPRKAGLIEERLNHIFEIKDKRKTPGFGKVAVAEHL